jgi:hypothetical protein
MKQPKALDGISDLEDYLSIRSAVEKLQDSNLRTLGQYTSVEEVLDLTSLVLHSIREIFEDNHEMYQNRYVNPDRIVGETTSDGTIESKTKPAQRTIIVNNIEIKIPTGIVRDTKIFKYFMDLLQVVVVSLKGGLILSDDNLKLKVEKEILEFFRVSKSRLAELIREDIATEKIIRSPSDTAKITPRRGYEKYIKSSDSSNYNNVRVAQNYFRSMIGRFGMSIVPNDIQSRIRNTGKPGKRTQKPKPSTRNQRNKRPKKK